MRPSEGPLRPLPSALKRTTLYLIDLRTAIEEFIKLFSERKIAYLSADREFLGHDWLEYLLSQPMMPFRIRIRDSELLSDGKHELSTRIVFSHLKIGQLELLKRKRTLWGHQVYVGALRLEDNSLLTVIVVSIN